MLTLVQGELQEMQPLALLQQFEQPQRQGHSGGARSIGCETGKGPTLVQLDSGQTYPIPLQSY